MLNFIVSDRRSIEAGLLVKSSYVVISIRDPDRPKVRIPMQSGLRAVLRLAFHDAEPTRNSAVPKNVTLMTAEHARAAWLFVKQWEKEVGAVVVHCEQGMSRSPAVAAALCERFGGGEACFSRDYQPNRYVYQMMVNCGQDKEEKARA